MKVAMRSRLGNQGWVPVAVATTCVLPAAGANLRVTFDGERPEQIIANEVVISVPSEARDVELPCVPDEKGLFTLRIVANQDTLAERYDFVSIPDTGPDPRLQAALADFRRDLLSLTEDGVLTAGSLYLGLEMGMPSLLAKVNPFTGFDCDQFLEEIERVVQHLRAVCHRPRQHLRIDDAIRPVGMVRRTGPAALRHLASHSEHWEARTVGGLRPARLLAQVVEDDLELYENRFVVSLIDRLWVHLSGLRRDLELAISQLESALDWETLAEDFQDFRRYEMLRWVLPDFDATQWKDEERGYSHLRRRIVHLQGVLAECVASRFYQILRRCQRIAPPIRPTNILTMDPHYHPLFELWLRLDKGASELEEVAGHALPGELNDRYSVYCLAVTLVALKQAQFEPEESDSMIVAHVAESGYLSASGRFRRGHWTVTLSSQGEGESVGQIRLTFQRLKPIVIDLPNNVDPPEHLPAGFDTLLRIEGGKATFFDQPTDEQVNTLSRLLHIEGRIRRDQPELQRRAQRWSQFIQDSRSLVPPADRFILLLTPLLQELGEESIYVDRSTASLLNDSLEERTCSQVDAVCILLPVSARSLPSDISPHVFRRLNNLGDHYMPQDASRLGDLKTGLIGVSPWQVNSLLRLVRVISAHTIGRDIASGVALTHCPVCNGTSIVLIGHDGYNCRSCQAEWNRVSCRVCNHQFGWVSPSSKPRTLQFDQLGAWLERLESIWGSGTVCSFCEAPEADRRTSYPVCPHCGHCFREIDYAPGCSRCRSLDVHARATTMKALPVP